MKLAWQSIRSGSIFVVLAANAFLLSGDAAGQDAATKTETNLSSQEATQRRAKLPFAKGTLQAHDFLRHTLKLKTADGVRTFTYTDRTYIFRGKDKITPDKLAIGEIIALRFHTGEDGRVLVQRIKAYGIPPPSTAESAKE